MKCLRMSVNLNQKPFQRYASVFKIENTAPASISNLDISETLHTRYAHIVTTESINQLRNTSESEIRSSKNDHDNWRNFLPTVSFNIRKVPKSIDVYSLASLRKSLLHIDRGNSTYKLREKFKFNIQLKDRAGRNILSGGDMLRIWVTEDEGRNNVNGLITDYDNGTYSGEVLLPWAGRPLVYISLSHTRQAINTVMAYINKYGLLNKMYVLFEEFRGFTNVTKPCGPLPVFGRSQTGMCNLTNQNYGYSWYSEAPVASRISCDNWVAVRGTNNLTVPDDIANAIRYYQHIKMKGIPITVVGDREVITGSKVLCNNRNRTETWKKSVPSGFYYKGKWKHIACKSSLTLSTEDFRKCLNGRHLLMFGDSNVRSHVTLLVRLLYLTYRSVAMPELNGWHNFVYADNKKWNISLSWYPHESPFFANYFIHKNLLQPISKHIDEIGAGNNSIIFVHLWGHYMRIPFQIFRFHVRQIRVSFEKLLKRSPDVELIIKGPHAMTYSDWITPVDYIRQQHEQIWFEEFYGLHDKVLFMTYWDITVGTENIDIHPTEYVVWDQIHNFMKFICH